MEFFVVVGEVYEVDVVIGREYDKVVEIFSIFISLWRCRRVGRRVC